MSDILRKVVMTKKVALAHLKKVSESAVTFTVYFSDDSTARTFVANIHAKYGKKVSCHMGFDNAVFITNDSKVAGSIQKKAQSQGLDVSLD